MMKKFGLSVATNFDSGRPDAMSGYPVMEAFGKRGPKETHLIR